jgi:hypothetical protein
MQDRERLFLGLGRRFVAALAAGQVIEPHCLKRWRARGAMGAR